MIDGANALNEREQIADCFQRIEIAGCPVDIATIDETIGYIKKVITSRSTCRHGFVNAAKVVSIQSDKKFRNVLSTCDLINADGMAIVWASQFLGNPLPERVNGTNLMLDVIRISNDEGYRIYFLGAKPEIVKSVVDIFQTQYPRLKIAGWHHGYFPIEEEANLAKKIREMEPDILFVGMGTPQKEYWLHRNVPNINVPFSMGVGGSFDVIAGLVKRAPNWMQNSGLEWSWRFLQEPKRMWRRYLIGNSQFLHLIVKEKIKQGLNKN